LNRTKILYVIDSMTKDGAEAQLLKTLARLDLARFEAFVVLSREAGERYNQLLSLPIVQSVTVLDSRRRASISSLLEKAFRLGGIAKAVKPDIVHSWLWYSNFLCGLAHRFGLISRIPFIASQRGDYHARYGRFRLWLTERFIYQPADLILTNTDGIREELRRRYPEKQVIAIQNLIDLPDLPPKKSAASSTPRIVSVGRLSPEKGHTVLIEALNLLNTKLGFPNFRATILGEGELKSELNEQINRYQLSERVTLPGFSDDVFSALLNAEVFVLPSLHESSPNALIEAMSVGLPCIASAVGGILDLIEHNESGLLVPPGDSEALARAIQKILTNRPFAENLGNHARLNIHRTFDNDRSIQQLETVYQQICIG
jgi:glycosyltransferase involved in cell wall biosynthesis